MIWICTLCLLALAAWLFFNGLNELRWVQAHSHDESVASDKGLLPGLTALTSTGLTSVTSKLDGNPENSRIAKAVSTVQNKSSEYGKKILDSTEGTAAARVSEKSGQLGKKLADGVKSASGQVLAKSKELNQPDGIIDRTARQVSEKSGQLGNTVAQSAKNGASKLRDSRLAGDNKSIAGKVVGSVSRTIDKIESKVESKVAKSADASANREDLAARAAANLDKKINELDGKMAQASKDTVKSSNDS